MHIFLYSFSSAIPYSLISIPLAMLLLAYIAFLDQHIE